MIKKGFRSSHQPKLGDVDSEFDSFQGQRVLGPPVRPNLFTPSDVYNNFPSQSNFTSEPAPAPNDLSQWATDFQNQLHITSSFPRTSPSQASSSVSSLLRASNKVTSWHHDFLAQGSANDPPHQLTNHTPYSNDNAQVWNQSGAASPFIGTDATIFHSTPPPLPPQTLLEENAYDEAAFERAFEAARDNISYLERTRTSTTTAEHIQSNPKSNSTVRDGEQQRSQYTDTQHILSQQSSPHSAPQTQLHHIGPHVSIGAKISDAADTQLGANTDTDPDPEEEEREANALAQTAAKVLDSVADNTSQKFRHSTFLGLMRQLRDGEVRVKGDEMVHVNDGDVHGDGYGGTAVF